DLLLHRGLSPWPCTRAHFLTVSASILQCQFHVNSRTPRVVVKREGAGSAGKFCRHVLKHSVPFIAGPVLGAALGPVRIGREVECQIDPPSSAGWKASSASCSLSRIWRKSSTCSSCLACAFPS